MAEIRKTREEETGAGETGGRWVLTGTVAHGKALGRTVGMPTANLAADPGTVLPPAGVYAAIITLPQGRFMGLTNIETYLFDFDRDIYGERARLELCFFIRGIQKINGLEEVWAQVRRDEAFARQRLGEIYQDEKQAR